MKCVIDINAVIDIEKSVEDQVRNLDESGMNDFVNGMKEEIKDLFSKDFDILFIKEELHDVNENKRFYFAVMVYFMVVIKKMQ